MITLASRAARLAAAALLAVPLLLSGPSTPAHAAACDPLNRVVGDINSDGIADVVTGIPALDGRRGGVDMLLSDGTRSLVTAASLGLPSSATSDAFGNAVATADLNLDGCSDLVIGASGRNSGKGAIYLAFGSPSGTLVNATIKEAPTGAGLFGASLLVLAPQEWNGTAWVRTHQQVVVGAPWSTVSGHQWAGAIYVYHSAPGDTTLTRETRITRGSPGVPGVPALSGGFGGNLAGKGRTIVDGDAIDDVGTAVNAGSVTILSATAAEPTSFTGQRITQNTAGVPGAAEDGDGFGEAVALRDGHLAISSSAEDIGDVSDAGSVQLGTWDEATRVYTPGRSLHQDTPGIPGSNEDVDRFGYAVSIVKNLHDQISVAIGTPGDRVGTITRAGSVTLVPINTSPRLPAIRISQYSPGVPGRADVKDHFGTVLSYLPGSTDGLIVSTPDEIGPGTWRGSVSYTRNLTTWDSLNFDHPSPETQSYARLFGGVLAQPAAAR
ncbi:MAG: FG-GAP repeat protein [Micropruina sp.]|nr:FG-GAP repeat protein [Micropruina sp.]